MKDLYKEIQDSFHLLDMEYNWDDEGADECNTKAFNLAIRFIHSLILELGETIPIPDFSLCRDSSIDIKFERYDYQFLINFKENSFGSYGCYYKNKKYLNELKNGTQQEIFEYIKKYMI